MLFTKTRTTSVVRPLLGVTVSHWLNGALMTNGITCPLATAAIEIVWTAVDAPAPCTKEKVSPSGATLIAGAPQRAIVKQNKTSIRTMLLSSAMLKRGRPVNP